MPKVRFLKENLEVEVPDGTSILEASRKIGAPEGDRCGGVCACSTCHVYVVKGFDNTSEVEDEEFDILEMLMRNAGRVLSRDALMENFYNRKATPFDRSIDMHISHLRKKLDRGEALIKTIRGVGYQFSRTGEDEI